MSFQIGERVRVLRKLTIGHSRVPAYVRGAIGNVERVLRDFLIPEDDAFGRKNGRRHTLYRVRFATTTLLPPTGSVRGDLLGFDVK